MATVTKLREEIENELLTVIGPSIACVSSDYRFICAVTEQVLGPNRFAGEAASVLKPLLADLADLREKLEAAERKFRITFARLKEDWLLGD